MTLVDHSQYVYDLHFQTVSTSSLMVIFRDCKSSLEWIPAQSPLETLGGVLLGDTPKIKSVRGISCDKKTLMKVLMSFYEDREEDV
jgi:hypothetical protein